MGDEKKGARNRATARIGLIPEIAARDLEAARAHVELTLADLGESDLVTDVQRAIGVIEIRKRHWTRAEAAILGAAAAKDDLDRATAAGLRGLYALELGRIEVAAAAFDDEQQFSDKLGFELQSHLLSRRRSILHRLMLYLATDRAAFLERLIDETLAIPELTEKAPVFIAELELHRGIARMAEEPLGAKFDIASHVIFESLVAEQTTPPAIRQACLLRLAHQRTNLGDWRGAAEALDALPSPPVELERAYSAASRARILRENGPESFGEAKALLDAAWDEVRASLYVSPEDERSGSGILHYERVRLLHSERIETALAIAGESRDDSESGRPAYEILADLGTLGELHREFDAPEPTLAAVRARLLGADGALGGNGGIALYLPASDRTHVVLVDGKKITHHRLPSRDAIERARKAFNSFHSRVPPAGTVPSETRLEKHAALSRAFSALLLPDEVQDRIASWDTLTLVGLDLLRNFPVSELRFSDGKTLGSRTPISILPSLSVGLFLADRRAARGALTREHAVFIAAPTLAPLTESRFPQASAITMSESEARARVAAYKKSSVRIGPLATWAETKRSITAETAVLQVLLHGARDSENLGNTALLFAGDPGVIGSNLIEGLSAPPCVLATACGSGAGAPRLGDPGSADLVGSFLRSGADAVVVSLGDLSYRATLDASTILHEEIARGATPAAALRALHIAGAELDPAHRSSLIVFGLGHHPVIARGNPGAATVGVPSYTWVGGVLLLLWIASRFLRKPRRVPAEA